MRRFRLIAVGLVGLLGAWLMWRQFAQRRTAARQGSFAPEAFAPAWPPTRSPGASSLTSIAATAEISHQHNNLVAQPQEPAAPSAPRTGAAVPDADLWSEPAAQLGTVTDTDRDAVAGVEPVTTADAEPDIPAHAEPDADLGTATDATSDTVDDTEPDTVSDGDRATAAARPDDLIEIEGIGPKISTIVYAAGIRSFADLAAAQVERLEALLDEAGIHTANPSTWPEQAQLAAQGKWDELKELQGRIKNGRLEAEG